MYVTSCWTTINIWVTSIEPQEDKRKNKSFPRSIITLSLCILFTSCEIMIIKGAILGSARSARAPPLFLPRPESSGHNLHSSYFGARYTPKFPALPRCAPPLFSPDWRPCVYLYVFVISWKYIGSRLRATKHWNLRTRTFMNVMTCLTSIYMQIPKNKAKTVCCPLVFPTMCTMGIKCRKSRNQILL